MSFDRDRRLSERALDNVRDYTFRCGQARGAAVMLQYLIALHLDQTPDEALASANLIDEEAEDLRKLLTLCEEQVRKLLGKTDVVPDMPEKPVEDTKPPEPEE